MTCMTQPQAARLRRALTLPVLTLYGLGTIVGAGIYALVGKVASEAGTAAPVSFALAALVAAFTGLSYGELSARLPQSAGEASYVSAAWGQRSLSQLVGYAVVFTGLVSAAAIANGFVGYARLFVDAPASLLVGGQVVALGLIAAAGIELSAGLAVLVTCIELGGLLIVLAVAGDSLAALPARAAELWPSQQAWSGVSAGAFLAFYAFVGFEDMVNMAEEVQDAPRAMPRAIVLSLSVATLLYVLIALVAVLGLPLQTLRNSDAPLAALVSARSTLGPSAIGLISMVAVVNGALVQLIMASRVLYGMGASGAAPGWLAHISHRTQTPLRATALVTATVLLLALAFPIVPLAKATSFIILTVFVLVNASLLKLKRADGPPPPVSYPTWVPFIGLLSCLAVLVSQLARIAHRIP